MIALLTFFARPLVFVLKRITTIQLAVLVPIILLLALTFGGGTEQPQEPGSAVEVVANKPETPEPPEDEYERHRANKLAIWRYVRYHEHRRRMEAEGADANQIFRLHGHLVGFVPGQHTNLALPAGVTIADAQSEDYPRYPIGSTEADLIAVWRYFRFHQVVNDQAPQEGGLGSFSVRDANKHLVDGDFLSSQNPALPLGVTEAEAEAIR